jgi:hypothetical protein
MKTAAHWIVTADAHRAHFFECGRTEAGSWALRREQSIERSPDEHEHHRPALLGRGPAPSAVQHFASFGHGVEEEHRRFAREIIASLRRLKPSPAAGVALLAAPAMLGALRAEVGDDARTMPMHAADLTKLAPAELLKHPAVQACLESMAQQAQR